MVEEPHIAVKEDVGHTVVDVDAHYSGTFDELAHYVEEGPWKDRFEQAAGAPSPIKNFWPRVTSSDDTFRQKYPEDMDVTDIKPADLPGVMASLEIDKIVFLGDQMIAFDQLKGEDRRPTVYANAYVDWLLDKVVDPGKGIYGTVPVPYQAPDEAAELIDRVADEPGIVGAAFITSLVEPPLGNRRYDVIYDALDAAEIPALFHGGTPGVDSFPISGYTHRLETHTLGFLWANTSQLVSIVAQGIPEKFPDVDFVFQECGLFYIPLMMYRMDAEYLRKPHEAPLLEKRPSEYMKDFYYSTQPLEEVPKLEYLEYVIEMIGGPDKLMYSSDYPHPDYDAPTVITNLPFLSEAEKELILSGNAEEVFDL